MSISLYSNKFNYFYIYEGENINAGWSMLAQLQRDNRADRISITYICPAGNGLQFINLDARHYN